MAEVFSRKLIWAASLLAVICLPHGGRAARAQSQILNMFGLGGAPETVNVHFVPHSHMDAGWLKTYDDYFEHEASTLLKSVIAVLVTNPEFTYTLGDIAFLRRYF